jgi:hypothetical protein
MGMLSDSFILTLFTPDNLLTDYRVILGGFMSWQIDVLFVMLQFQPDSIVHFDEQPSPSIKLPSSHCKLIKMPSPQIYPHLPPISL